MWPGSLQTSEELDVSDRSGRLVDVPVVDTAVNRELVNDIFGRVDEVDVGSSNVVLSQTSVVSA